MLTLQFFTTGVLVGGIYALIAVGIVLVYKATRIFNFAVGELLALGGFFCYTFFVLFHFPLWLSALGTLIMAVITGSLVERLVLRPLLSQSFLTIIMATLALSSVLRGLMLMVWGAYSLSFPEPVLPRKPLIVRDIVMPQELMWGFVIAMVAFVLLAYFFLKTRTGLKMRAVSEDHELSMACGVNITHIFAFTWILAVVLASMGGVLLGNRISLSAVLTPPIALKAFPAVLFGGVESIAGAIIGGLITGIIENLVGGLIDPSLGEISPYVILLLVLILRPTGLFGLKRIERI